jgi:hypothetical protein
VYSQGLLLTLLTLWLFLRLMERPTLARAVLYCLAAAAGMYSQPLTCLPVFSQALYAFTSKDLKTRFYVWAAAAVAGLTYLPWWFAKLEVQKELRGLAYFFSLRQITPAVLLHELTGGGYASSIVILLLAAWPARAAAPEHRRRTLLVSTVLIATIGPIAIDAVVPYYFAARQILFAMPALILLAAQGFERLRQQSASATPSFGGRLIPMAAFVLPGLFVAAGAVKNFHQATVPRDDLDRTAEAVVDRLPAGGCLIAAPPEHSGYYTFLRPQLRNRVCREGVPPAPAIVAVASVYSTAEARQAMAASIPPRYAADPRIPIGRSELTVYRLRP